MTMIGMCALCGRPAAATCPLCGRLVCLACVDSGTGVCKSCAKKQPREQVLR